MQKYESAVCSHSSPMLMPSSKKDWYNGRLTLVACRMKVPFKDSVIVTGTSSVYLEIIKE